MSKKGCFVSSSSCIWESKSLENVVSNSTTRYITLSKSFYHSGSTSSIKQKSVSTWPLFFLTYLSFCDVMTKSYQTFLLPLHLSSHKSDPEINCSFGPTVNLVRWTLTVRSIAKRDKHFKYTFCHLTFLKTYLWESHPSLVIYVPDNSEFTAKTDLHFPLQNFIFLGPIYI